MKNEETTKKEKLLNKLTSRKFIVTLISIIVGIITLIIGENEKVQIIASFAMIIVPQVVYCIVEGKIDANSVKTITQASTETAEKLGAPDEITKIIENASQIVEDLTEET